MQLIKFSNGKWGIRKGWIFHKYLWFDRVRQDYSNLHWTRKESENFTEYCATNEERARAIFNVLKYGQQNKPKTITDEVIE